MTAAFAVRFAVIDPRAGELGIKLTGAVPSAVCRRNRGCIGVEPLGGQIFNQVAAEDPPVRHQLIHLVIAAPAGQAMNKHIGIVGLPFAAVRFQTVAPDAEQHGNRQGKADKFIHDVMGDCFHEIVPFLIHLTMYSAFGSIKND